MKAIFDTAINRSRTAHEVNIEELRESGKSRDNLLLRKGDKIVIPEEIKVWFDTFVPKGKTEAVKYYMITIEYNGKAYDATMKTFRRSRDIKQENLEKILDYDVNRTLHSMGDDEQRAIYLRGKTLEVVDVIEVPHGFEEGKIVRMPLFKIVD